MSDPVKNVEIEDVLSSIRKLVAEDARVAPAAPKPRPDRLILTPAQRVSEAPKADEDKSEAADPVLLQDPVTVPKPRIVEEKLENIPGDARLADFGEVEGSFPDIDEIVSESADAAEQDRQEFASEAARLELGRLIEEEVAAALHTDDPDTAVPDPLVEEVDEIAEETLQWDSASDDEVSDVNDDLNEAASAAIEEVHVAEEVTDAAVSPPPMTLEDKVAALGRLVAREPQDFEEERDAPDADELTAVSEPMTWPQAVPEVDSAPSEPEKPVETTTAAHSPDASWSAAQDASVDAPETPDREEKVEPEAQQVPDVQPQARSEALQVTTEPDQSLQIDEEMLRQIVSDIVRQELQGTLGERITRNVRKLVRREIHRMLIQQDLD